MKKLQFWQVDAFASAIFKGNPAAVFFVTNPLDDKLMQNIAMEMNLSETAFILLRKGQNPYLRWFTPICEVDLCGHATLAAAHVLFSEIYPNLETVVFDTKLAGPLSVRKNSNNTLTMDLPSSPGDIIEVDTIPLFVVNALSKTLPILAYKSKYLMLVYNNEETIVQMKPNFNALIDYEYDIIVTAQSINEDYDFVSRVFCASDGILEDPVTGSAHCTLTPYWSKKLSKIKLCAYQSSKRGGQLNLELYDNRLLITGKALTVLDGSMRI